MTSPPHREVITSPWNTFEFQVTVYINGCETETLSLPLQGILMRKVAPTSVVVGHAGSAGGAGAFHLSGVQVYRAPALSASLALHLAAHGPDHACQVPLAAAQARQPPHWERSQTRDALGRCTATPRTSRSC